MSPSNDEILVDPVSAYPDLHQLLGGYFHQDWVLDDATWEEAVDDFVAESPRSAALACIGQLDELLARGFTDSELEQIVQRLDGAVDTSGLPMTAGQWLAAVRRRVDAGA